MHDRLFYRHMLITGGVAVSVAVLLWISPDQGGMIHILRVVLGTIFLLFLPGWRLTHVFFVNKEIDLIERSALSFALSISIVPLLVFYINLVGVPITVRLVRGVCLALIVCSGGWIWYRAHCTEAVLKNVDKETISG